jgi:MraZ protein
MALFLSIFENKVDQKGRVSVPSQFRAMLKSNDFSGIVLYPSSKKDCIEGCDVERIKKISEVIDDFDAASEEKDAYATVILGSSAMLPFDTDGRVVLPKNLLEITGINDKAIFIGKGQTFEIWEPKRFEKSFAIAKEQVKNKPFSLKNVSKKG